MLSSVLFGIPFSEMAAAQHGYRLRLPSPEEFAMGKLLELEKFNLVDMFPELETLSTLLYNVFEGEHASTIINTGLSKAYYGSSRYDNSYYDPPAMMEFLKSTLYALTKKRSTDETVRTRVEAIGKALDIREELVEYAFNALQMMSYSKINSASFDYAWFDVTHFPNEGSEPKVDYVNWNLEASEASSISAADSWCVCWFDNCVVDYNYFAPDDPPTIYISERAGNLLTEVSEHISASARGRLLMSSLALANYQTARERADPRNSIRLESYAVPRSISESIRSTVASALRDEGLSPLDLNLYISAALELAKMLTKPSGWGNDAFRAMSREELRNYFVLKWSSQGLRADLLDKVFNALYDSGMLSGYAYIRMQNKEFIVRARS